MNVGLGSYIPLTDTILSKDGCLMALGDRNAP